MTRSLALTLAAACVTPTISAALPVHAFERAKTFAVCSGRLSALSVRQHAQHDPAALATQQMMIDFDLMLEATLDAAYAEGVPERQPRVWRADGWSEIAALLNQADHSGESTRSKDALAEIDRRIEACRVMILPAV